MLERLSDAPAGVDALKAVGVVSRNDYETVIEPLVDTARAEGRRIRILCEFGPEFQSFAPGAAWEDLKVGTRSMRLFEGCAIVSDVGWIREATRLTRFLMPCPVRAYDGDQRAEALRWLASLPEGPGVSHRILPDSGVLLVTIDSPLRTQDFDALASTVDSWLDTHEELTGVVLHARDFPGWENVGGLLSHLRFVRDHHRRIGRIGLAADTRLADLMPHLANHFVRAEVRHFGYEQLDDAVAWAAAAPRQSARPTASESD
ncbi:STAS/SEC14 domain-containing protein [Streptomyces sp. NPDC020412]|uniref:STAS/SEC14 domain-containing protein n=1 Tax=Streptomyces sp. NPDC020412 TaxID=3365073 RepID=UPI0037A9E247